MKDNYDFWLEHDHEEQEWLDSLPICDECGEPIQTEHCYNINGNYICKECIERYRVCVDDIVK